MSKSKRKQKLAKQHKAAAAILENRDLEKNPLTATEILALPRNQRPPRSEWPDSGVGDNPLPYTKGRGKYKRSWFPASSGGSGEDVFNVIGFLILWATCSAVHYGVYTTLWGSMPPYTLIFAIIAGLISAIIVVGILKGGGSGGFGVTHWW